MEIALSLRSMLNKLDTIKAMLGRLTEPDLRALRDAAKDTPGHLRGMSSWISTACEWELNRRGGLAYGLPSPQEAFPPQSYGISVGAALAVRATFAKETPAVRDFFDALALLLYGERRQ